MRALAVTSRERNASLPTVPTMREAGVPGYEVIGWYGLYGPARLASEIVARLNAAANRALADADLRKTWQDQGYDLWPGKARGAWPRRPPKTSSCGAASPKT